MKIDLSFELQNYYHTLLSTTSSVVYLLLYPHKKILKNNRGNRGHPCYFV